MASITFFSRICIMSANEEQRRLTCITKGPDCDNLCPNLKFDGCPSFQCSDSHVCEDCSNIFKAQYLQLKEQCCNFDDCCTFGDFNFHAERGKMQAQEEAAIKMLEDGMPAKLVAQYSGLPLESVKELEMNI